MAKKEIDITKTGPQGFKAIQDLNSLDNAGLSPSVRDLIQKSRARREAFTLYNPYEQAPQEFESSLARTKTPWGKSMFDETSVSDDEYNRISDIRAENQPWYSKIGAGVAKGTILAGTTFLDGTLGLLVGAGTAIQEGRWSGLWDNDFSRAMKSITDASEDWLPNYYTEKELNSPWYENIFSANFLGDKFIKNLGFTIGAFYSGNVASKALGLAGKGTMVGAKALGASVSQVKNIANATPFVSTIIGATTSAVNEGRIEALNNSTEWFNLQKMQLDDKHFQMLQAIEEQYGGTEMYNALVAQENNTYNSTLAKLAEDRAKMGNADLLMNIPILMASNLFQFGKLYGNGFKTAKKATNIVGRPGSYATTMTTTKGVLKGIGNSASEALEEISQKAASNISGIYYQDDVNSFHKAKIDPDAEQETVDWIKSFAKGINETVNDGSTWEEGFIGFLTGALGMPSFRSSRNADGRFQSPIYLQEGLYGGIRSYREQMARETELANQMNARVQSPEFKNYYKGITRHNVYQKRMNQAVLDNDEFQYKNDEYNQLISDIIMFDDAGKLEDLKYLIGEAYNTSDENLESIIKNTTSKTDDGQLVGPYSQYATLDPDGNIIANLGSEDSKKEMITKFTESKDEILNAIQEYSSAKNQIELIVGDRLNDEQLKELTWLKVATDNLVKRSEDIYETIKPFINKTIGYLSHDRDFIRRQREIEGTRGTTKGSKKRFDVSSEYEELSKAEKNIQTNIDILGNLNNSNAHIVAAQLYTNKKDAEVLKALIANAPSQIISATESEEFNKKVDDLVKIVKLSGEYSRKLEEYLKEPQKKVEDDARAEQQVAEKAVEKAQSAISRRINWNGSISSIADALEENKRDIESAGGMTEFMKTLTPEQKKKVKKAIKFTGALNRLSSAIDNSDLSENQKRIAHSLVEENAKDTDDIQKLGDSIQETLDSEEFHNRIAEELAGYEREHGDWTKERIIDSIESNLKEFFDTKIEDVANAVTKAEADREKLERAREKKAAKVAESLKEEGDVTPKIIPEEKEVIEPSEIEGMDNDLPQDPSDMSSLKERNMMEYNPKTASPIEKGHRGKEYSYRPQISELYLHGYNMETYLDFINKHPEAIPEDVDVEAFKQYIREVHQYLKDEGAFTFVNGTDSSWKMEVGDTIVFEYNKELSEKAGTPVVVMVVEKQNKRQVVGTLPTSLDFNSLPKYVKTDVDGKPITDDGDNWIWETEDLTVGELRPAQKELYNTIIDNLKIDIVIPEYFSTWKENVGSNSHNFNTYLDVIREEKDGNTTIKVYTGSTFLTNVLGAIQLAKNAGIKLSISDEDIRNAKETNRLSVGLTLKTLKELETLTGVTSPKELVEFIESHAEAPQIKTKVSQLMGGKIVFSSNQSTVSKIFGEEFPVIAVYNESSTLSTGNVKMDAKLLNPTNSRYWQVYVMVPANNGKYLPALAVSTPLYQLPNDDWYKQQIVKAIQKIPTSLRNLKENTSEVFKWLNIPGLSIRIGKPIAGGRFAPETEDISNATHIRITFTNPNNPEGTPRTVTIPIEEGKISDESALKAVNSIITRSTQDALDAGLGEPTTNVDIKKLTDNPEHREYRKNIARYLYTNIDSNSPHTRNDWFLYEPTQIEREAERQAHPSGQRSRPQEKQIHGGSREAVIDGEHVEIDKNKVITDIETGEIISMETIDLGTNTGIQVGDQGDISTSAVAFSSPESSVNFGVSESEAAIAGRRRRRARPTRGSDMEITEETSKEEMSDSYKIEKELERIKKMFPQLSDSSRILVVNGLRRISDYGNATSIYGHFRDGIVYINSESPMGTGFHEAFHYVVQALMTNQELDTLFKEASKHYGNLSEIALEEKLAEDFRHFVNGFNDTTILGKIKSMFRNLKYIIKQLTKNINYLDNLFYSIYRGNYANRTEVLEDNFRVNLLKLKNSRVAYEYLSEDIKESLEARGISREDYNNLNTEDKERMIFCLI